MIEKLVYNYMSIRCKDYFISRCDNILVIVDSDGYFHQIDYFIFKTGATVRTLFGIEYNESVDYIKNWVFSLPLKKAKKITYD